MLIKKMKLTSAKSTLPTMMSAEAVSPTIAGHSRNVRGTLVLEGMGAGPACCVLRATANYKGSSWDAVLLASGHGLQVELTIILSRCSNVD